MTYELHRVARVLIQDTSSICSLSRPLTGSRRSHGSPPLALSLLHHIPLHQRERSRGGAAAADRAALRLRRVDERIATLGPGEAAGQDPDRQLVRSADPIARARTAPPLSTVIPLTPCALR